MKKQVNALTERQGDLVFANETLFNQKHVLSKAWMVKGTNLCPKDRRKPVPPKAAVVAISRRHGLIHFKLRDKSIDSHTFIDFLKELRAKLSGTIHILLDNCSIHHTKRVERYFARNDFVPVFNAPYCPLFNAIELAFAEMK